MLAYEGRDEVPREACGIIRIEIELIIRTRENIIGGRRLSSFELDLFDKFVLREI